MVTNPAGPPRPVTVASTLLAGAAVFGVLDVIAQAREKQTPNT